MVVRRTPFSDNPQVGARGQRTGRRILDAARTVLARTGYHRCSVESITREAGFSRATFYQYFADKEAAFAELAAEVADELRHAAKALRPVTADPDGWQALRDWVDAYAAVYDRHEAVFQNFAAAAAADPVVRRALRRGAGHHRAAIRRRVATTTLDSDVVDGVIDVATPTLVRTLDDASILRRTTRVPDPDGEAQSMRTVLLDAYVDVVHRTLFGLIPDVNVHDHDLPPLSDRSRRQIARRGDDGPTHRALLDAARSELAESGFHGTTIDSIVERAGMAHGTFYRYFTNKEAATVELVTEATEKLSIYIAELAQILAGATPRAELRDWLGRYVAAQLDEMSVLRVWAEAALVDDELLADAAPMLEWGRQRVARPLAGRGFGGASSEALVLVAMVDSLGSAVRPTLALDAAAVIVQRGFLGRTT